MADVFKFTTYEGNVRDLRFDLRRYLDRSKWDVSGATQIYLEATNPDGTEVTPIAASPTQPGADWVNGVVCVTIGGGNITSQIGTWSAALTLWLAGEEITVASGVIEVLDRPGYVVP